MVVVAVQKTVKCKGQYYRGVMTWHNQHIYVQIYVQLNDLGQGVNVYVEFAFEDKPNLVMRPSTRRI